MRRTTPARPRIVGAVAGGVLVVALLNGASTPTDAQGFPLDRYPGFGRFASAAQRDNTIAYWEAFKRERIVATCMRGHAFDYAPSVAFPSHAIVAVAAELGVAPQAKFTPATPPIAHNRAVRASLSPSERNRYDLAYVGESTADITEADRSGRTPTGRGADFATRGCVGVGNDRVPSVWDTRRQLAPAYDAMRRALSDTPEFAETRDSFGECVRREAGILVKGPGELEAIISKSETVDASAARTALRACMPIWNDGYTKAEIVASERFIDEHASVLAAAERRYREVDDRIREDRALHDYLAAELRFVQASGEVARP